MTDEIVALQHTWESNPEKCWIRANARDAVRHRLLAAIMAAKWNGLPYEKEEAKLRAMMVGYVTEADILGDDHGASGLAGEQTRSALSEIGRAHV